MPSALVALIGGWLISGWKVFKEIPDGIATHDCADIVFREASLEKCLR